MTTKIFLSQHHQKQSRNNISTKIHTYLRPVKINIASCDINRIKKNLRVQYCQAKPLWERTQHARFPIKEEKKKEVYDCECGELLDWQAGWRYNLTDINLFRDVGVLLHLIRTGCLLHVICQIYRVGRFKIWYGNLSDTYIWTLLSWHWSALHSSFL